MAIDDPLLIERREGTHPGTVILQITGPITLRNLFDLQAHLRSGDPPRISIMDLSGVPYMDSAGMGAVVNYYVRCSNKGCRLILAGVSSRVMELFHLTKVDSILRFEATVEEAEASLA